MRHPRSPAATFLMLAVMLTCAAPALGDEPFVLFEAGNTRTSIIVPGTAGEDVHKAVDRFQELLVDGYGIEIPRGDLPDLPNRIELRLEDRSFMEEDRATVTFPDVHTLRITGGEYGVIRTLFVLLEKFGGIRFLHQAGGDYNTHFPPTETLTIPRETFTHDSAFPLGRSTVRTEKHYGPNPRRRRYFWKWEVMLGAKQRVDHSHGLTEVAFPVREYAKRAENGEDVPDPEMFPVLDGKRFIPYQQLPESRWGHTGGWQPCFTSQAAVDEAVTNLLAHLDKHPHTQSLSLGVIDLGGHCQCADCLAMDDHEQTNTFHMPNRSESYYRWLNEVVERVTERHPDVYFTALAYREVFTPPTVKLHPNIVVKLSLELNATIDADIRAERKQQIRDWREHCEHIAFSAYDPGPFTYTLPRVFFKARQDMVRHISSHGGSLGQSSGAWYFSASEGPKLYLHFKLLENPDLDLDATLDDWCAAMVGTEASGPLQEYWAFWEDYWRTKATKVDQWWSRRDAHYLQRGLFSSYMYGLQPGDMARCRELMERVVALAEQHGTPRQKQRAALQMTCFEWYEAAAKASAAELIDPDGGLPSADAAVKLLRRVPEAVESFGKWHRILETTPDWRGRQWILNHAPRGVVAFSMTAVGPHLGQPAVRDALRRLADNDQLPAHIRNLARAMGASADGTMPDNVLSDGSFERDNAHGWDVRAAVLGEVTRTEERAHTGTHALRLDIEHGNYSAKRYITNVDPTNGHYVAMRFYIPEQDAQANDSGHLEFTGEPITVGWNRPKIKLTPGRWQYVCTYIPANEHKDELELTTHLPRFEDGTNIYIDDVQVFAISNQ